MMNGVDVVRWIMRRRVESIRLPTEWTRSRDARWSGASRARAMGGRGLLISLIVHGAAVAVAAALLTARAPAPMADVVAMAWIETPAAEAAETREVEIAEPAVQPAVEPPLAVPVTVPRQPPVAEWSEPAPEVMPAAPDSGHREVVEKLPVPSVPAAAPTPTRPTPPQRRQVAHRPGPNVETIERADSAPVAATPPRSAPDPVASPSWNAALAAWLHRNKTYPAAARFRGEQGSGQVRFTVARDGRVLAVELVNTTGSPNLDEAVRRLLDGARVPAFPVDMPHAEMTVNIRINYSLRQEGASP